MAFTEIHETEYSAEEIFEEEPCFQLSFKLQGFARAFPCFKKTSSVFPRFSEHNLMANSIKQIKKTYLEICRLQKAVKGKMFL